MSGSPATTQSLRATSFARPRVPAGRSAPVASPEIVGRSIRPEPGQVLVFRELDEPADIRDVHVIPAEPAVELGGLVGVLGHKR